MLGKNRKQKKDKKAKKREKNIQKEKNIKNNESKVVKLEYGEDFLVKTLLKIDYTVKKLDLTKELQMDIFKKKIDKIVDVRGLLKKYENEKDDKLRNMLVSIDLFQNLESAPLEFIQELGMWGKDNIVELAEESLLDSYNTMYQILVGFAQYKIDLKKK